MKRYSVVWGDNNQPALPVGQIGRLENLLSGLFSITSSDEFVKSCVFMYIVADVRFQ